MLIVVDASSSEPLYRQIHDQVVAGIATGELEPGMSLPSVRSLASDLGINLHTVNKAYAVLRDEGYVRMRGRSGAVVTHPSDVERVGKSAWALEQTEEGLFKLALAHRARGGTRGQFLECAAAQAARAYGTVSDEAGGLSPGENVAAAAGGIAEACKKPLRATCGKIGVEVAAEISPEKKGAL